MWPRAKRTPADGLLTSCRRSPQGAARTSSIFDGTAENADGLGEDVDGVTRLAPVMDYD
jgi:hypothetical protein